jgi:hypothetical protein
VEIEKPTFSFWQPIDTGDGTYTDGQVIYPVPCVLDHSFPANLLGSEFYCTVAPADGDVDVVLTQAGVDVATLTYAQGQDVNDPAAMVSAGWSAVAGGGKFGFRFPTPADSAFAGLHGAMLGTRY